MIGGPILPQTGANPTAQTSVRSSIQITPIAGVEAPQFRSYPVGFQGNMYGSVGPTPGDVLATNTGTVVNLSLIKYPGGLCSIFNKDLNSVVTVGVYIPGLTIFIPILDLWPQEGYVVRLSQYLGGEEPGTGTGTYGLTELMVRSPKGQTVYVTVQAFDA